MLGLLQYSKGGFEHVAVFFFLLQDHSFLMQAGLQQTFQFLPQKEKKGVAGRLEPAADKTTSAASSIKDAARGNTPAADKESRPRFWHRVPAQEPAGASVANISVCWLSLLQTSRILHAEYLFLLQPSRWSAARFKNPAAEFSVSATHKPCACCRKGTFYSRKKKICCRNVASQREQKQQIRPFADFYGKRFQ